MSVVKEFNGLNGAVVSRDEIQALIDVARKQEQFPVVKRLEAVLRSYPDKKEFQFEIEDPAFDIAPESVLDCLNCEEIDHEEKGLGKPVSADQIYDMITDLMINTIKEVGHLPWQKGWNGTGIVTARNYVTKKPYTGINALVLSYDIKIVDGKKVLVYPETNNRYFLTFNQIEQLGAHLKKGSKGREVVYYNFVLNYKDENNSFSTIDAEKFGKWAKEKNLSKEQVEKNLSRVPLLKYYNVFSSDDCEGLKALPPINEKANSIEIAQNIIDSYPNKPKYKLGTEKASYSPSYDLVSMPKINAFKKESDYYSTFFHEITHSTGHPKRLSRDMSGSFGNKEYAYEELIAELGAVYLCAESGILFHTRENSAKYLRGWNSRLISSLENDNRFFMKAAAQAQKAANHILDLDESGIAAYTKIAPKEEKPEAVIKPKKESKPKKKTTEPKPIKELENEIIGYALVDNIDGSIVASKKTLDELKEVYLDLEKNTGFEDFTTLVYSIISKSGKNVLGDLIEVKWIAEKKTSTSDKIPAVKARKTKSELEAINPAPKVEPNGQTALFGAVNQGLKKPLSNKYKTVLDYEKENNVPKQLFNIQGDLSKFLGKIEIKPVQSLAITLDSGEGGGKTHSVYQWANIFCEAGYKPIIWSLEEHAASSLASDKAKKYFGNNIDKIAVQSELEGETGIETFNRILDSIPDFDVIFIDSWAKIQELNKQANFDHDFRKKFNGKLFVIIFQRTTSGEMRGGSKGGFDGDIILKVEVDRQDFRNNYIYNHKNRYNDHVPLSELKYSPFNQELLSINKPEPTAEPADSSTEILPTTSNRILSFVVN